ncbi:serine hydrolase domain-containing protein [Vaginella massiliensis]|uniref:serine hydrolase domain-containing protein n=1 Tax=Vaginella massiliensis TaxID=1816680 RepID=UPI000838F8FE|nr:serine hydrolase domain-containing protein [Vaginella massiliensis]
MKNFLITLILITFATIFYQCKKQEENQLVTQENTEPRFDSINWFEAAKFKSISSKDLSFYRQSIQAFYDENWASQPVSAGLLVAKDGKIIFERYSGYADVERGDTLTEQTPLHIASVSKVMTSLVILKLVEHERLALDQTVKSILPSFPYPDITVRHLLNHRSGLPNYYNVIDELKLGEFRATQISNDDVLRLFAEHDVPQLSPTNTKFSYSNTNFALLALVIEKLTQKSYPEAMDYMLFKPLGMSQTFVFEFDKHQNFVSSSYGFGGKKWEWDHLDKVYGDKNIYSTPRDIYRMDYAMYSDKFLPKKLLKEAFSGYSYESKGVKNYGLGFRMMEYDNGNKFLYHNGWWHGNYSVYVHDPKHHVAIIALGNRQNRKIYDAFSLVSIFSDDYPISMKIKDSVTVASKIKQKEQRDSLITNKKVQ